jgi:hypothetical protein
MLTLPRLHIDGGREAMVSGSMEAGTNFPADTGSPGDSAAASFLRRYWPFPMLVLMALVLRAPVYGNPDVSLDEEFYLVVADRMLHGALPYVDIWDRKPIGLFLIYAATRLLGGEGFVQYQIMSSLFAGATAGFIWLIARRASNSRGGILAALCYLFWINMFSGSAGQSPVFYNLFIAAAAWLAFRANDSKDMRHIARMGMIAMFLCGLTLQVKYTAVAESAFLGIWFLWRLWRTGGRLAPVIGNGLIFVLLGLAPTLAVCAYYAAAGHFQAFAYANFWSIFDRGRLTDRFLEHARNFFLVVTFPLAFCIPFAMARRWQLRNEAGQQLDFALLAGWLVAAGAGFVMIGNFYDHYFLPLLVPLFITVAVLLTRPLMGVIVTGILIAWAIMAARYPNIAYNRDKREKIMALTEAVRPYVNGADKCLFIFDGPAIVYMTTQACIPTRYVYPDHLSNDVEKNAIGADTVAEMRHVLASRPGAIIAAEAPVIPRMNQATLPLLRHALMTDYVLAAAVDHPDRTFYVYARKDLLSGKGLRGPVPYAGR